MAGDSEEGVRQTLRGLQLAHDTGEQKGKKEGKLEGLLEGKLDTVHDICEILDIEVSSQHEAALSALDVDQLDQLIHTLKRERQWPD